MAPKREERGTRKGNREYRRQYHMLLSIMYDMKAERDYLDEGRESGGVGRRPMEVNGT